MASEEAEGKEEEPASAAVAKKPRRAPRKKAAAPKREKPVPKKKSPAAKAPKPKAAAAKPKGAEKAVPEEGSEPEGKPEKAASEEVSEEEGEGLETSEESGAEAGQEEAAEEKETAPQASARKAQVKLVPEESATQETSETDNATSVSNVKNTSETSNATENTSNESNEEVNKESSSASNVSESVERNESESSTASSETSATETTNTVHNETYNVHHDTDTAHHETYSVHYGTETSQAPEKEQEEKAISGTGSASAEEEMLPPGAEPSEKYAISGTSTSSEGKSLMKAKAFMYALCVGALIAGYALMWFVSSRIFHFKACNMPSPVIGISLFILLPLVFVVWGLLQDEEGYKYVLFSAAAGLLAFSVIFAVTAYANSSSCPLAMGNKCIAADGFYCASPAYNHTTGNVILTVGQNTGANWADWATMLVLQGGAVTANAPYGTFMHRGALATGKPVQVTYSITGPVGVGGTIAATLWACYTYNGAISSTSVPGTCVSNSAVYYTEVALVYATAT